MVARLGHGATFHIDHITPRSKVATALTLVSSASVLALGWVLDWSYGRRCCWEPA